MYLYVNVALFLAAKRSIKSGERAARDAATADSEAESPAGVHTTAAIAAIITAGGGITAG